MIGAETGLSTSHLVEVAGPAGTPRPRDVELDRGKLKQLGIEYHTPLLQGVMDDIKKFL